MRQDRALSEEELEEEWQQIDGAKRGVERRLREAVRDTFLAQAARIEDRLEQGSFVTRSPQEMAQEQLSMMRSGSTRADEVLTVDAIFDLETAIDETSEATAELLEEALQAGFRTGALRIDADETYDPEQPWVQRALRALNGQMEQVPRNTREVINQIITEGQSDPSKSVEDIAQDITDRMRRMASGTGGPDQPGSAVQSRARRVAATSTTTAFETAQDRAWRSQGVEASSWLSQRDGRVSDGHFEADGQRRMLGTPFNVARTLGADEEELMYPGDPDGRASNIVNCRCSRRPLLDINTE